MKLGRTIVIACLFLMAFLGYLFQRRIDRDVSDVKVQDEASRVFFFGAGEEVKRIEIFDQEEDQTIALELTPEGWILRAPVAHPANTNIVREFIPALRYAASQKRLAPEKDWAEYGLETPRLSIMVVTDQGNQGVLTLGDRTPVGNSIYARWSLEPGYVLLPTDMESVLGTSLYGFREKRIFTMPPQDVRNVFVELGANTYQWKKKNEKWYWLEPINKFGEEVPSKRMELVLSALSGLYAREFLEETEKTDAEMGFFMIQDRVVLKDLDGNEEVLYFGDEVPLQNAYYGMKKGSEEKIFVERTKIYQLLDLLRAVENEKDLKDGIPEDVITAGAAS